jgi:competence protein ComEC
VLKLAVAAIALIVLSGAAADTLDVYFVDVEGGQATLIVTPDRRAIVIDGGWAGFDNRDARRVLAAAQDAGVARIDYLVATHFHGDHIGAVPELARLIAIDTFVDNGRPIETGVSVVAPYAAYAAARARSKHLVPRPGDPLPLEGVEITVLTTGGEVLAAAVEGAGGMNPACSSLEPRRRDDRSENARSVGLLVRFGAFRFIDLGDLSWNPQRRLVCPNNLIGTADLFLTPHHGNSDAVLPATISALRARAIVSDNSATKGAGAEAFETLHRLRGPADVWQLHRSTRRGVENFPDEMIANVDGGETAHWIKVSAHRDGRFAVTNARNGLTREYPR